MKRLAVCATTLALALAIATAPARAQEKYVLGYGAGT